jgi:hypothetical protein
MDVFTLLCCFSESMFILNLALIENSCDTTNMLPCFYKSSPVRVLSFNWLFEKALSSDFFFLVSAMRFFLIVLDNLLWKFPLSVLKIFLCHLLFFFIA